MLISLNLWLIETGHHIHLHHVNYHQPLRFPLKENNQYSQSHQGNNVGFGLRPVQKVKNHYMFSLP